MVEGARVGQALVSADSPLPAHRVPADLRHLQARRVERAAPSPAQQPEPLGAAELGRATRTAAACPGRCRARGTPASHALAQQLVEPELAHRLHRLRERAHAGQHDAVGARGSRSWSRVSSGSRPRARAPSRPSAGCPSRSRGSRRRHRRPFGGRHARRRRVDRHGLRSARANALNSASTMWCGLRARLDRTCSGQLRGVRHGAEELLGQVGVEAGDARAAGTSPSNARERPARRCRSPRARAPRPSARRRGRSARCPRGRRAPGRAPGRARARRPRRCGAAPVSRSPVASTSRSSPPWRATASSMWSKKPTPGRARARARRRRASATADVGLVGGAVRSLRVRLMRGAPSIRRGRGSPRRGRAAAPAGASRAAAPAGNDTRAIRRRKVAGDSADCEARGAAGGQHVVRARRRSRRRRWRRRGRRTGSRRERTRSASASASAPDQLEVLGRDRVGQRARRRAASVGDERQQRVGHARALRRQPLDGRAIASSSAASGEISATRRVVAVLGLGQQVERDQLGVGARGGHHHQLARPGDAVDADLARHLALGLLHLGVARARRSRRPAGPTRCRRRARRSPGRRPSGRPRSRRTARRRPGSSGARARPGPGGAHTASSSTPATRAVTAHMTTVDGYGARPPGT